MSLDFIFQVPVGHLRPLPQEFTFPPAQAIRARLGNIRPAATPEDDDPREGSAGAKAKFLELTREAMTPRGAETVGGLVAQIYRVVEERSECGGRRRAVELQVRLIDTYTNERIGGIGLGQTLIRKGFANGGNLQGEAAITGITIVTERQCVVIFIPYRTGQMVC